MAIMYLFYIASRFFSSSFCFLSFTKEKKDYQKVTLGFLLI